MNSLKMNDVDRVILNREISRSLAPKPREIKGRPMLRVIDKLHESRKLERELKELNSYV